MMAFSNVAGCFFMVALVALPICLQVYGYSPFWLIPFAFLFNIFWLPLDKRATFHANAQEIHGDNAGYVTLVKPIFMALWVGIMIYGATYALRRWLL